MPRSSVLGTGFFGTTLLICVFLTCAPLFELVSADAQEGSSDPNSGKIPDDAALLKLKVKDLKAILDKKGPDAACLACTSKQEYVLRIHETIDWPEATAAADQPDVTAAADQPPSMEDLQRMFQDSQKDERIQELRKKLEEAGIDTGKMFTASGINQDEIIKEKKKWEKLRDETIGGDGEKASDAIDDESKSDL